MFYAHIVLAKKGPLARIWLAAHWDKKITKAHVFETNIEQSVDGIMQPKVKLALRTSGHLLLGVVRIYARKAKYLLADCNEAFVKIKMAFRPGMVDLPEEHREAAVNAITLPEVFHDFDTPLPELNDVDIEAHFSINQSRADEITMREDYGTLPMNIHDDGFGDMGFDDTPDIVRDRIEEPMEELEVEQEAVEAQADTTGAAAAVAESGSATQDGGTESKEKPPIDKKGLRARAKSLYEELSEQPPQDTRWNEYLDDLFTDPVEPPPDLEQEKEPLPGTSRTTLDEFDPHHPHIVDNDGFGDEGGGFGDEDGFGAEPAAGLFEGDIFADAPLAPEPELPAAPAQAQHGGAPEENSDSDDDDHFDVGGAPSPAPSSDNSRPPSPIMTQQLLEDLQQPGTSQDGMPKPAVSQDVPTEAASAMVPELPHEEPEMRPEVHDEQMEGEADAEEANVEQTTLLQNEEESFALAPVDASALKGVTKSKRKRKLIVDEVKNISGEEMKSQLANTTDIVTTLDLAPPTKRLMYWKETGGVEKLFALPSRDIPARCMFKNYQRHLTSRSIGVEEFDVLGPLEVLGVEQQQPERPESPVTQRRGRKRRVNQELLPPETPMTPATPATPATPGHLDQTSVDQMRDAVEMPPPTPVSMELRDQEMCQSFHPDMPPPATPGISNIGSPQTPLNLGMQTPQMMPPTPGMPSIPMTPGNLIHGGLTPAGLAHGGLTPAGLAHGGLTPAGLAHGGLTPAGLAHGGLTPAGLAHGGLTPAGLAHGGLTPAGLAHGGLTPGDLNHGGMTPAGLQHGNSGHVMPDLPGAMTPHGLDHGGMTPHHASLENIDQIPNLPADQVSSILNEPGMENFSNLGYDGHAASPAREALHEDVQNEWNQDYEFPQSVGAQQVSEEQQVDETIEQFEERVLNKRAAQLFISVRSRLLKTDSMVLSEMTHRNDKKQAAQKFYSLLVLKKFKALEITQPKPYDDITITRGPLFENPIL